MYMNIYIYVCVCMCIYIYIYILNDLEKHIHIYTKDIVQN